MNFVSFSVDYWDGPRANRQNFLEELGRQSRVMYVSPPFYIVKLLQQLGRGTLPASGVRQLSPGLIDYTPSKWLFTNHRVRSLNETFKELRLRKVRTLLRRYGLENPILLIWHPQYADMVGQFGERLVVYYAYDQYSGYTGGDAKPSPTEIKLLERADLVFTVSHELMLDKQRFVARPSKVVHLPNAVDFERFSAARHEDTRIPDDIDRLPRPRLGYIGSINEKLNLPVLEALSTERPNCSVVLIGRDNYTNAAEKRRFQELVARPNVHWLGYREYDLVPAYIKGLDVCMMCYVVNDWTFYGDPLKLHEYLASGKPTIGTGLRSVKDFADVVMIPDSPNEWVAAVDAALAERDPELVQRRIDTARANSYSGRIQSFLTTVEGALNGR